MNSLGKDLNLSKCALLCTLALALPAHVAYGDNFSGTELLGLCSVPSSYSGPRKMDQRFR